MEKSLPVVAIIGRPNVGKSALFNRLVGRRQALVDATPGLTRDRLYAEVSWRGVPFLVVDTGGLQFAKQDRLSEAMGSQVAKAMEEADLALLVGDAREGPVPLDAHVVEWARRWSKPVLLVANKVDTAKDAPGAYEFASFGIGQPSLISGLHGLGIGDLLDQIVAELKKIRKEDNKLPVSGAAAAAEAYLRVAIVGRPNVGKSSLINRILNEDRVLVDDRPGTTRDPVEMQFSFHGIDYRLVDTAGVAAKRKLNTRMEVVARLKALEMIPQADVCLGVIDASVGLVQDDLKLFDQVVAANKPLCLAVNKWDLKKAPADAARVHAAIVERAPFLKFARVICTSAKTGLNVVKTLEVVAEVAEAAHQGISSVKSQDLLTQIKQDARAPVGIRNAHLFRLFQAGKAPPTFHLLGRVKRGFKDSDMAYLERRIREKFGFEGTPIRIRILSSQKD